MIRQLALVCSAILTIPAALSAQAVLGWHNDILRTGWYRMERILNPTNVNSSSFGKVFTLPADGKVDAQPLYVPGLAIAGGTHNVLYVATEHGTLYAYDADTSGAPLWRRSLLGPNETPSDSRSCSQVSPEIGITATPAIDLTVGPNGVIYTVVMSKDASGRYHHRLHAIDLLTGTQQLGGPVEIRASYPGTGDNSNNGQVVFDPAQYKHRAGLAIANGSVVLTWSSHCDRRPYTGWIMTYDKLTLAQRNVLNVTPNGANGGIWHSGGAPAVDGAGNVFVLVGNGTFDTTLDSSGFPVNGNYGNAFLKLSTATGLAVTDYFNMFNTVDESRVDQDLGSGGPMVLIAARDGAGNIRQLAVGAGKDGHIYVVDRNNMGKFSPTSNNIFQDIVGALSGGQYGGPAYFNRRIYFGASGDGVKAFTFSAGRFEETPVSSTSTRFGYPGTTPSVSSLGAQNAILWAHENSNPAVLHAYDAMDLSHELYNTNQAGSRDQFGPGNKYITPVIVNGRVYVGTTTGVSVFGLLSQP